MFERVFELPKKFTATRDRYLNRYSGKNLDGLNTARIADYFASANLAPKPYIVVKPEDLRRMYRMDRAGLLSKFEAGIDGQYNHWLGMSIIVRNPELEEKNGTAYTEGLIVHEGAHSDTGVSEFLRNKNTGAYHISRIGFKIPDRKVRGGDFLEEGWAGYHQGAYLTRHFGASVLAQAATALNWTKGPENTVFIGSEEYETPTPIPFKYIKLTEKGRPTVLTSSLAGFAVELLVRADPEIYAAMHAGRSHVEGLRKLGRLVGALSPDLYPDLRQMSYTEEDFTQGLRRVIDDVSGGFHRVAGLPSSSRPDSPR